MILEDYEALKCRYPSKKCWNQRAVKRNGERHNLCEMHRQKANNNQRRLDKKRKAGHLKAPGDDDQPEHDYHHQPQPQHPQQPHQQSHQDHYEHQEKRMRVRLTDMYAAAQALSPHHPQHQYYQHQHYQHHHSNNMHPRELAPIAHHSPPRPQQQMLHLPPLTSHIPLTKKSFVKTESPTLLAKAAAGGSSSNVKPTILLPPITSVPRCQQQFPLATGSASSATGSPHDASWNFRRYGKEEKINSA